MVNNLKYNNQASKHKVQALDYKSRGGAAVDRQLPLKDAKLSPEVVLVRVARRAPPAPQPAGLRLAAPAPRSIREAEIEEEADDVIDLGAPRQRRRPSAATARPPRRALPPNPRLYPGPKPKPKPKPEPRARRPDRARRRKRTLRPVPNSRLYRPGPPRPPAPPPPPARPRASWPPPPPARALDTASRVALRLGARASSPRAPAPPPARAPSPAAVERARRLVVTLPAAAARYRPASEHFRARAAPDPGSGASTPPAARLPPRAMEPGGRSASPEDRSESNETLSAPSEILAEFLSAIMRRQYAEALKYCRLILQYEPHNATARGFYPLLRTKVARSGSAPGGGCAAAGADSSGDEAADAGAGRSSGGDSPSRQDEEMSHSAEESDGASEASAGGEQSELELDSSDALQSSPSLSLSRRTERTDSASASAGCWDSSASGSRSDPGAADDNGNNAPALPPLLPDDLENDNATDVGAGSGEPHHSARLKGAGEALSPLQRLRAQFACSIK